MTGVGESEDCWVVTIQWIKPIGGCNESVLSLTPPTSICQNESHDCVFITNQTQYKFVLTADQTYDITVICRGTATNNTSDSMSIEIHGNCS